MTNPVSGGVPEQPCSICGGERTRCEAGVLCVDGCDDAFLDAIEAYYDTCRPDGAPADAESKLRIAIAAFWKSRAALERPRPDVCPECGGLAAHWGNCSRWRPALPAPPAFAYAPWVCVRCGVRNEVQPVAWETFVRCANCGDKRPDFDLASFGAALPAEHAPPEPSAAAILAAVQAEELVRSGMRRARAHRAAREMLLAAYAVDFGSAGTGAAPPDARIAEIEARLKAATPGPWSTVAIPAGESELAIPHDENHTGPCICGERVEHVDLFREFVIPEPVEGQHRPEQGINVFAVDMAKRQQENVACLVHVSEDEPNVALIKNAPEDIRYLLDLVRGGGSPPPPSAPSLPDTFVERAIQTALKLESAEDTTVMLSLFESVYIRQKYAERNASAPEQP